MDLRSTYSNPRVARPCLLTKEMSGWHAGGGRACLAEIIELVGAHVLRTYAQLEIVGAKVIDG